MFYQWRPYVPVAARRAAAAREMEKLRKEGHAVSPVRIQGRTIAHTFWGKAWCENLERYSDYANRLPRGRTYARNGSIVDLQIAAGEVQARVSGSSLYTVTVRVTAVAKARWRDICGDCAGAVSSLVELLQGRLSDGVMERLCRQKTGLFPTPAEIGFSCSCPDWASMCKHVAAVLYGVGARLDQKPELLFTLRQVDSAELIANAGRGLAGAPAPGRTKGARKEDAAIASDAAELGALFGLEMADEGDVAGAARAQGAAAEAPRRKPRRGLLATPPGARAAKALNTGKAPRATKAPGRGKKRDRPERRRG
jgi:uncharacterized Zn finger protein